MDTIVAVSFVHSVSCDPPRCIPESEVSGLVGRPWCLTLLGRTGVWQSDSGNHSAKMLFRRMKRGHSRGRVNGRGRRIVIPEGQRCVVV